MAWYLRYFRVDGTGRRKRLDRRSGQIVIFSTMSLFVLFSVMGLSVDLGYSYLVKISAQGAADSAAAAAAAYASGNGYICGGGVTCGTAFNCANPPTSPPTTALEAGCLYASANGFKNSGNQSVSLIANNTAPPNTSGNSPALWIQARVAQTVPHSFLFTSGSQSSSVAAQAIGGVTATPDTGCVYVLDRSSTQDAFYVSGNGTVSASGCGVFVNSSNSKAMEVQGTHASVSASLINVHGNYAIGGGAQVHPTPTTATATVADPFINLPAPTFSGCNFGTATTPYTTSVSASIGPGVYCGGITVSGGTLTLSPGTYILNGGGLVLQGQGQLAGNHVMFFLTGQGDRTPGPMLLQGGSNISLSAPNGGPYQGILFYQDRNATYGAQNAVSGGTVFTGSGTFYFPTTQLNFAGGTATNTKVAFVAYDLIIAGTAAFAQDATGEFTGLAKRTPGLIQ